MSHLSESPSREETLAFISESASYGNLGAFIGAGFSKAVLNDDDHAIALSWGELLEQSARQMNVDYESISKIGRNYPDIATAICKAHAEATGEEFSQALMTLKGWIASLTSWYPDKKKREKFSKYLACLSPAWIITTNFDLVIENLLTGTAIPLGPNDSLSAPKGVVPVYHLHGVRTNPADIIIAQEDYVSLFRPNEYRQIKLALTIRESTTLLLGYGLGDVNVLTALDWSRNVFNSKGVNYPHDVIQLLRKAKPRSAPYRDSNGILILETAHLSEFFEEFIGVREKLLDKEAKERLELTTLSEALNAPDRSTIDTFIADPAFRAHILTRLSRSTFHLIPSFMAFLDKCIEETWVRSKPSGAFEGYNQNLVIILDILMAFPLEPFPPALLETAAYALERVSCYIGNGKGQSWSAHTTWQKRGVELPLEMMGELLNISNQHGYSGLSRLLLKFISEAESSLMSDGLDQL